MLKTFGMMLTPQCSSVHNTSQTSTHFATLQCQTNCFSIKAKNWRRATKCKECYRRTSAGKIVWVVLYIISEFASENFLHDCNNFIHTKSFIKQTHSGNSLLYFCSRERETQHGGGHVTQHGGGHVTSHVTSVTPSQWRPLCRKSRFLWQRGGGLGSCLCHWAEVLGNIRQWCCYKWEVWY